MTSYKYQGDPFGDYSKEIAEKVGVRIVNNIVNIPSAFGTGIIKNIILEENFSVRYFNFSVNKETSFYLHTPDPEQDSDYKLVFILNSKNKFGGEAGMVNSTETCLYSSSFKKKGIIKANVNFKCIAIIFSSSWLDNNYAEAGNKLKKIIQQLGSKNKPAIISAQRDSKTLVLATELSCQTENPFFAPLHIKTTTLLLLNDFFNTILNSDKYNSYFSPSLHYDTMLKVEAKIIASLSRKLPALQKLAAEFNLSLSTLKRHFRIVYGKNIYQYYQEKRMELGKLQVEQGQRNISEIATNLGFFKINNFSKAFKKYFGVLPRELRQKALANVE